MNFIKNLFKFISFGKQIGQNNQDIKPLTEFLKNNDIFIKSSLKVHNSKENLKRKLWDKLMEEDNTYLLFHVTTADYF